MPFESLAYRHTFTISGFPDRWMPLIHLYDPDLPLFPIYYFHVLPDNLIRQRPLDTDRAFGYIERIHLISSGIIEVTIVTNKNLSDPINRDFVFPVEQALKERLGISNPVLPSDVQNAFSASHTAANAVLTEIWQRVVSNAYGNMLPFGKLWDEVLGLTRFVASWYSQGGRKGELIQTHYFMTKFGERVQSAGGIPQLDFYLLPTIQELTDIRNPLAGFNRYAQLLYIAEKVQTAHCSIVTVSGLSISKFNRPNRGQFNTQAILNILNSSLIPHNHRAPAFECFNTFDKGPQRTIIFLMMLDDLRKGRLKPSLLTPSQCGSIYDGLNASYQSPKVISIYAQQGFGNVDAMPIDTWIETFLRWPLAVYPEGRSSAKYQNIFSHSHNLGKVERLLWVTGQARKVHSSACNNALWCLKYSSKRIGKVRVPRGANPLACKICLPAIRRTCPAFMIIRDKKICFNANITADITFKIMTSADNNNVPNQTFVSCEGKSIYGVIFDDFSPADDPTGFAQYPATGHSNGAPMTVDNFILAY